MEVGASQMLNQQLIETYLARAQALEDLARRLEKNSPPTQASPHHREAASLRREANWWQAFAEALVKGA